MILTTDKHRYSLIFAGLKKSGMKKLVKFILLTTLFACAIKPKLVATENNTEPLVTYRLVSGWVGFKDELKIYCSGRMVNIVSNALSNTKIFRSSEMNKKDLEALTRLIKEIDLPNLKSEYRGGLVYDAPVENLTFTKDDRVAKIVIHAGADLPEPLTELLQNISRIKTTLQELPEIKVLSVAELITSLQSYDGQKIAVEGFFLQTSDATSQIVENLDGENSFIEVTSTLPLSLLKLLNHQHVIAVGSFFNNKLKIEHLEVSGG